MNDKADSKHVHIHIFTMKNIELSSSSYLVSRLALLWQKEGHTITVGPSGHPEADIGIINIDRTRISVDSLPDNPGGRPLLNSSILDISKRRISSNLLTSDSSYEGKVIIKTNDNHFGLSERSATPFIRRSIDSLLKRIFPWSLTRQLWYYKDYPICNNLNSVPEWVWERDDLVVERFVPEMEGKEFVLRIWVFFGDQEYGVRMFSTEPLVKAASITRYEYIEEVPESLRETRRELGMDFGKFDYVVVDGKAILLDVNKTPTVSGGNSPSVNLQRLASGLKGYVMQGWKPYCTEWT